MFSAVVEAGLTASTKRSPGAVAGLVIRPPFMSSGKTGTGVPAVGTEDAKGAVGVAMMIFQRLSVQPIVISWVTPLLLVWVAQ